MYSRTHFRALIYWLVKGEHLNLQPCNISEDIIIYSLFLFFYIEPYQPGHILK